MPSLYVGPMKKLIGDTANPAKAEKIVEKHAKMAKEEIKEKAEKPKKEPKPKKEKVDKNEEKLDDMRTTLGYDYDAARLKKPIEAFSYALKCIELWRLANKLQIVKEDKDLLSYLSSKKEYVKTRPQLGKIYSQTNDNEKAKLMREYGDQVLLPVEDVLSAISKRQKK
jgi:hypothetical protein